MYAIGGLNEENLKVNFNDIDFCLRLRTVGYKIVWTPFAELYHHESYSRGRGETNAKQARFLKEIEYMSLKWGDIFLHDPAYNPNLSLTLGRELYAFPPRIEVL